MGIMKRIAGIAGSMIHSEMKRAHKAPATSHSQASLAKRAATVHPEPTYGSGATPGSGQPQEPMQVARSSADLPHRGDIPKVFDVASLGLPRFEYRPEADSDPDPGEVVWTWVPYAEDRSLGKDRPVLVLAKFARCIVIAQMTSKDNVRGHSVASNGAEWMDIGSGQWDSKGRPSEVRIDRLLCVHPDQVRREGASIDAARFTKVVQAIREINQ